MGEMVLLAVTRTVLVLSITRELEFWLDGFWVCKWWLGWLEEKMYWLGLTELELARKLKSVSYGGLWLRGLGWRWGLAEWRSEDELGPG